jgi:hypothetical protein
MINVENYTINNIMENELGSFKNPIKCENPQGEIKYLKQLAGPNGERIVYKRIGSKKNREDHVILDAYLLSSPDFDFEKQIFMNMYVKGYHEKKAIEGLRIKNSFFAKQPWQDLKYFEERELDIFGKENPTIESKYIYLWSKAGALISCGPYIYAEFDAFGFPNIEWNLELLMRYANNVVHDLKGSSNQCPLVFETITDFERFMKVFHFESKGEIVQNQTNVYPFVHLMTKEELIVYAVIKNGQLNK